MYFLNTHHGMYMKHLFNYLFLLLLFLVAVAASIFMVLEAGEYFNNMYEGKDGLYIGYWAAALNEVFLAIMAAAWVPAIKWKKRKFIHPGNIAIKILMVMLFLNTVGGASMLQIQSRYNQVHENQIQNERRDILQSRINDQEKNLSMFIKQNQKVNAVLTTRKLEELKEELSTLTNENTSTVFLWYQILLLVIFRISIQLANLVSVWLMGWLYRDIVNSNAAKNSSKMTVEPKPVEVSKEPIHVPKANTKTKASLNAEPEPKRVIRAKPAKLNTKPSIKERATVSQLHISPKKIEIEKDILSEAEENGEELESMKRDILKWYEGRAEGVSLSDFSRVLSVNELDFKDLLKGRGSLRAPFVKKVHAKMKKLYLSQVAS